MKMYLLLESFLVLMVYYPIGSNCQRIAPGVPPQHYQQPQQYQQNVNPHMQQVPMQQQMPVQHQQQQMPVQHPQQPVQHQQIPNQQMHGQVPVQQHQVPMQPIHHGQPGKILDAANIQHEKEHIAEHLEVPIDTSKMSEQELQFHYFKMHDADNNNKLDGCELIKSLIHWHEQGSKDKGGQIEEKVFKDEELVTLIDPILNVDDSNKDGFIDYPEFVRAQQKAGTPNKPH